MIKTSQVKIIECPRDAMQGLHDFIPTDIKIAYINLLLKAGFNTIDFGSFVSPKAIPQMRDTAQVLAGLNRNDNSSSLLAIVANLRGAEEAAAYDQVDYLGFPFSVSETFQKRNTNSTMDESFKTVEAIRDICLKSKKEAVIYISMGFGNPYGDPWNSGIVLNWTRKMADAGIRVISIADTVGLAKPADIKSIFETIIPEFPLIEIGAHLHCRPDNWREKVNAAFTSGCKRFDSALKGFGGCPMAGDKLVGNLATENLVQYLTEQNVKTGIDTNKFNEAMAMATKVFNHDFTNVYQ